ncbi:helix-turn-helix domain-containing protein [Pumilibacter intestinalis]|jgi:transcriptional regulator with XRE-family HTH domain|uniref:helix-turn-helix domain-containing protein n=1 Tax=Pumilibacter intestinalis TaxID=2941511 RepID=UPI00203F32FD|nr:helix-turn-helix transcriptional regulator [Pumilibacter intestinalis]MCI8487201.1 helix-turn-helix transcriptional regulator [Clostridia bacterium]
MTEKERIDMLRIERGWTINKLAEEIGISNKAVYSWYQKNGNNPSAKSIAKACEAFKMSMTEFYSGVDAGDKSQNEILLIDTFRKVPLDEQDKVLQIVKIFTK